MINRLSRRLVVEFENIKLLDEWKKYVIKKYNIHGAVKLRLQEMVEKDLIILKQEVSNGING